MNLNDTNNLAQNMLSLFIDTIGLCSETYMLMDKCPVMYGNTMLDAPGEYVSPHSIRLKRIINKTNLEKNIKDAIYDRGMIVINKDYKDTMDPDLFVTLIHEKIHANRVLMAYDVVSDMNSPYYFGEGFEQRNDEYDFKYLDPSQEILHGSINDSSITIDKYKNMSSSEQDHLDMLNDKYEDKLNEQYKVDEALVELIALVSFKLYRDRSNIWDIIDDIRLNYESSDVQAMCEIIEKHHDFELFSWMIDPITYTNGDIHYDFFDEYTKDDRDLVKKIYESKELDIDDEIIDEVFKRR